MLLTVGDWEDATAVRVLPSPTAVPVSGVQRWVRCLCDGPAAVAVSAQTFLARRRSRPMSVARRPVASRSRCGLDFDRVRLSNRRGYQRLVDSSGTVLEPLADGLKFPPPSAASAPPTGTVAAGDPTDASSVSTSRDCLTTPAMDDC